MVTLDTSVLVRYFTEDDKKKASLVAKLLASSEDFFIPDVVFVELEYVLFKLYHATRREILEAYQFLVSQANMVVSKEVGQATEMYSTIKISMADCIVAASAKQGKLASFDKELIRKSHADLYWKIGV